MDEELGEVTEELPLGFEPEPAVEGVTWRKRLENVLKPLEHIPAEGKLVEIAKICSLVLLLLVFCFGVAIHIIKNAAWEAEENVNALKEEAKRMEKIGFSEAELEETGRKREEEQRALQEGFRELENELREDEKRRVELSREVEGDESETGFRKDKRMQVQSFEKVMKTKLQEIENDIQSMKDEILQVKKRVEVSKELNVPLTKEVEDIEVLFRSREGEVVWIPPGNTLRGDTFQGGLGRYPPFLGVFSPGKTLFCPV